jgi:cytosine/adenosine deaminase-related metal-dependent hydrolase
VLPIAHPPIADGVVAVDEGGTIRGVGRRVDLRGAGKTVEHRGVLMPALVNAHTHLELSGLGLLPGGDGLAPWIQRLLRARGQPDLRAIERAARQMRARGTIAVADVANGPEAGPIARAAGLELLELDERVALNGDLAPPRPGAVMTPHSTYTCGEMSLRQIAAHSGGKIVSIHVEEDPAEAGLTLEGTGEIAELLRARGIHPGPPLQRPVMWLDALGLLGEGTLLVHLTFADEASLARAAERRAIAVLCPRSNKHITGKLPPFARMRGLRVAIGTDSLASCPSLDVLGDVQCLARVGAEAAWLLGAATANGAAALKLPHLGTLEPGRRPGVICVGDRAVKDPVAFVAHEGADVAVERVA